MSGSPLRRSATSHCRCRHDDGDCRPFGRGHAGVPSLQAGDGIPYRRGEFVLDSFVSFVAQRWGNDGEVELRDAIARWCARTAGRKAVTLGNEFGVVRQLCLFRRRHDPTSYVPEHALAPVKESTFLPYIFSHDDVRQILAIASSHRGRFIWAAMLRTLILVLYCTGLRLGEAVRLRTADVDLDRGILKIQHSKGRSRVVAIRPDLVAELRVGTASNGKSSWTSADGTTRERSFFGSMPHH
jgi:integrase/recombinase XerD